MKRFVVLFGSMVCVSLPAFAAYPLAADDIGTVAVNRYELEAAVYDYRVPDQDISHTFGFSLRRGFTERLDGGILLAYDAETTLDRNPEVEALGLKYRIVEDWFAVSAGGVPSDHAWLVNTIVTRPVGVATVHFNLGYVSANDEFPEGEMIYTTACEVPWKRFEFTGEVLAGNKGTDMWYAGVRYKFSKDTFLGLAFGDALRAGFGRTISTGFHTQFGG